MCGRKYDGDATDEWKDGRLDRVAAEMLAALGDNIGPVARCDRSKSPWACQARAAVKWPAQRDREEAKEPHGVGPVLRKVCSAFFEFRGLHTGALRKSLAVKD